MAKKKNSAPKKSAAKRGNRALRKLTRSFASKLGVNDSTTPSNTPVMARSSTSVSAGNSGKVTTIQEKQKKKKQARRQKQRAKKLNPPLLASEENSTFQSEYASLVEREKSNEATTPTPRRRLQRRHAIKKPNGSNLLQFQPATFSMEKSTTQLVDEAVSGISHFGLDGTSQYNNADIFQNQADNWARGNPNIPNNSNAAASNNPFARLHFQDELDESVKSPFARPAQMLAFQPASFQAPSGSDEGSDGGLQQQQHAPSASRFATTLYGIDPDL